MRGEHSSFVFMEVALFVGTRLVGITHCISIEHRFIPVPCKHHVDARSQVSCFVPELEVVASVSSVSENVIPSNSKEPWNYDDFSHIT